jgi:O-antigen/teichoic acid export membrane protein
VALTGVENFHKHTFYGTGQVRLPALVEVLEQLVRTAAVLGLLIAFLPQYPERVVGLIVGGMVICEIFSSCTLVLLHRFAAHIPGSGTGAPPSLRRRRISAIAFPVGLNALLGNLLSAANATLIPQKLVEGGLSREAAVSAFGVVCGMTLPLLALPTVYLGPLNLVLSPRLTRAHSLGQTTRVHTLTARAMESVSLLTLPAMGMMCVLGPQLGRLMFRQDTVGNYLINKNSYSAERTKSSKSNILCKPLNVSESSIENVFLSALFICVLDSTLYLTGDANRVLLFGICIVSIGECVIGFVDTATSHSDLCNV